MPQHDQDHVKINGCFVVWDGITRPDQDQGGNPKYSLKVVVDPNNPDLALYSGLANQALQQSKFKGVLPAGGRMPIGTAQANEFNGMYTGWAVLNCNTKRLPDVYDCNGARMDPMQYGPLIYGGQQVDVLVHCYEYDKAGNRGIASGLDAFELIVAANAPRQDFGSAGIDTSGAFGGGGGQQPVQGHPQQGVYQEQQPQQNNGGYNQNQNTGQPQQQNQGGYDQNNGGGGPAQQNQQQNTGGYNTNQNQNDGGGQQQQQYGQPQQQQQNNGGGQQQQAHNFLPNQQ